MEELEVFKDLEFFKLEVFKDLEFFKKEGFHRQLENHYVHLPETKCNCSNMGKCCFDPPEVSYAEFLYAFNHIIEIYRNNKDLIELYKNLFRKNFLGLIQPMPCCFLNNSNCCTIYKVSPLSCKKWGHQPEVEYRLNLEDCLFENKEFCDFYSKMGIRIPDEVAFKKTEFCRSMEVVNNPHNFAYEDFEKIIYDIIIMTAEFGGKNRPNYDICDYMLAVFFNEQTLFMDRIKVIREYQKGNTNAVEDYIDNIDFEEMLKDLLSL